MINGPRRSRIDWNPTEIEASKVRKPRVDSERARPPGTRAFSFAGDKLARIWDARYDASGDARGRLVLRLEGHRGPVLDCAWASNGRRLATCSKDRTARIWDPRTGDQQAVLEGHGSHVLGVAFSPDMAHVATASHDSTARLWHVGHFCDETYRWLSEPVTALAGHADRVTAVAFGPDSRRVVTCGFDRDAILWDVGHVMGPPAPAAEHASVLSALTPLAEAGEEEWVD